jgi:hypothetical protein
MDTVRRLAAALLLAACAPGATCGPSAATSPTPATITPSAAATTSTPNLTTAATAIASPTVAPSPTAREASRYGYITASEGRIVVRGERATDSSLAIGGDAPAASHDGTRIAFWRTGPQGNNAPELRIVEVASGSERVVTMAPSGWNGGAIAWSDDDAGLLYEVDRARDPNAPPGPPVAPPSRMFSIDLSTPSAQPVTDPALDFDRGLVFIPLAWERSEGVAAALTTGEGGYAVEWVVWDKKAGSVKKTRFPWQIIHGDVRVSANASMVLANDRGANALRFWPLADIGNAQTLPPGPDPTVTSRDASWRPGSQSDFAWVTGFSVSLYTFGTDRVPTSLYRGRSDVAIATWRADGSGLLLNESGRGVFVVDLATLQPTALPHVGFTTIGGVLLR